MKFPVVLTLLFGLVMFGAVLDTQKGEALGNPTASVPTQDTKTAPGTNESDEPKVEEILEVESVEPVLPEKQWGRRVKLTLAKSCIGEAGFDSFEGECAAIAWIYLNRSKQHNRTFYRLMMKYSSAVRYPHRWRRRPWLPHLNLEGTKPKGWPKTLAWYGEGGFQEKWLKTLELIDDWYDGQVPNPLPEADHYGGAMDTYNPYNYGWYKLDTPEYQNFFYDSDRKSTEYLRRWKRGWRPPKKNVPIFCSNCDIRPS